MGARACSHTQPHKLAAAMLQDQKSIQQSKRYRRDYEQIHRRNAVGMIAQKGLMSVDNPLWGAPRIHGELLKLGFEVAQSSVAKYMVKRPGPPSQGWRTFLRNHAPDIAAMDLFVAPTIGFDLLYASSSSG